MYLLAFFLYNQNVLKIADKVITKDDDLIILGKKGITHFGEFESRIDTTIFNSNISDDLINSVHLSKKKSSFLFSKRIIPIFKNNYVIH